MKRFLFITIGFLLFGFTQLKALEINDTIFDSRRSALDNLEILKGAMVDSTLINMKELAIKQQILIDVDNIIMDQYLPALKDSVKTSAQKLNELTTNKTASEQELKTKNNWVFYGKIAGGVLFLLFLLFTTLFLVANTQKRKLKKQLIGIDKMREDNLKEIELARTELEKQKEAAKNEIEANKQIIAQEINSLKTKIESLTSEKSAIERKFNEKYTEFNQLSIELNNQKNEHEKQITVSFEKISYLENEIAVVRQSLNEYKELYEKQLNEQKQLEEQISEAEKATIVASQFMEEHTHLKEEKEYLQSEINRLNEQIEKESHTKNFIENELSRMLDNLRGSH